MLSCYTELKRLCLTWLWLEHAHKFTVLSPFMIAILIFVRAFPFSEMLPL